MALSRIKTWIAEILYYADLNAEFNNILNNGGGSLSSPRTANFDLDGYTLIFDGAGNTYAQSSTTGVLDFYYNATLFFRFDMDVSSGVNALSFVASATGVATSIEARGSDTDISINLVPKGAGTVQIAGVAITATDAGQAILAGIIFGG